MFLCNNHTEIYVDWRVNAVRTYHRDVQAGRPHHNILALDQGPYEAFWFLAEGI